MPPFLFYISVNPYNCFIAIVNETQQNKTIKQELHSCLDFDKHVKEPIIDMMPDSIVDDMRQLVIEESRLSKKYTGRELLPDEYENVIAGHLFEMLNYNEYVARQFRGLKEGTPEWENAETLVTISSTLCKVARYPQEYGLNIDIRSRIPDGVYTGINKQGEFVIFGLAEAKLGDLDSRALSQIALSGSRTTMANVVEQVDALIHDSPREELHPELQELADRLDGKHIQANWNEKNGKKTVRMGLDLLVPTRGGSQGTFSPQVFVKRGSGLQSEYDRIKTQENVNLKSSPFSAAEVHMMAGRLLTEMGNES